MVVFIATIMKGLDYVGVHTARQIADFRAKVRASDVPDPPALLLPDGPGLLHQFFGAVFGDVIRLSISNHENIVRRHVFSRGAMLAVPRFPSSFQPRSQAEIILASH